MKLIVCRFVALHTRDFATDGAIGIDRGVSVPLMLSDSTAYMLPERLGVIERRARKGQRIFARRKRGSNHHTDARNRIELEDGYPHS